MKSIDSISDLCQLVAEGETNWSQYGEVNAQEHGGMVMFTYSPEAQWHRRWNYFERISRGLVIDRKTGAVIARPFDKFFNWGEIQGDAVFEASVGDPEIEIDCITEKMDGSLGVVFFNPHTLDWQCSTTGSFTSDQAIWANAYIKDNFYVQLMTLIPRHWTLLFEIIYPENRIVIDYKGMEAMVLLAGRDNLTGKELPRHVILDVAVMLKCQFVKEWVFDSVEAVLNAARLLPTHREGWVIRAKSGERFKVKGDAYKLAHKILSQLSFKGVLEAVASGALPGLIAGIPDEFLDEVRAYQNEIETEYLKIESQTAFHFHFSPHDDRKAFAEYIKRSCPELAPYMFGMKDGYFSRQLFYKTKYHYHKGVRNDTNPTA